MPPPCGRFSEEMSPWTVDRFLRSEYTGSIPVVENVRIGAPVLMQSRRFFARLRRWRPPELDTIPGFSRQRIEQR